MRFSGAEDDDYVKWHFQTGDFRSDKAAQDDNQLAIGDCMIVNIQIILWIWMPLLR